MRLASSGKSCQTTYKVLERFRHYCFVEVHPLSGRLHQIRVHMASLGCPVVGDRFYGSGDMILLSHIKKKYKPSRDGEKPLMGRLALHAFRMTVQHPTGGHPVAMEAPLHKDFELSLKNLRRYAGR
jgi:23S rRNA-/tRNA-specific pseudouridylate synthase